jgi:hypothetical protein
LALAASVAVVTATTEALLTVTVSVTVTVSPHKVSTSTVFSHAERAFGGGDLSSVSKEGTGGSDNGSGFKINYNIKR